MDDKAIELYKRGLSAASVGKSLQTSQWNVYRILKKYGVGRRSSTESNKLTYLAKPTSFDRNIKPKGKLAEVWKAGLLLYLGEGSKRTKHTVDLANSDPMIVMIFLRMLREVYNVSESRLRVQLYHHQGANQSQLIHYWSKITCLHPDQFTKPYVKAGSSGEVSDKMKNGLVHIRYSDRRLWQLIIEDMKKLTIGLLG